MNPPFTPAKGSVQQTLAAPVSFSGVGLHSGQNCQIRLQAAPPNHGLVFVRRDLAGAQAIPAHFDYVVSTANATTLGHADAPENQVRTVEHLMAGLFATGITNALIEVWGPEIPILDGSAQPFIEAFLDAGLLAQPFTRTVLRILRPIKIFEKGAVCELLPRDTLRLTVSVDFNHPAIGLQTYALDFGARAFGEQVARARTFGFFKDFEKLRSLNLALGADLSNVLAFSEDGVLNPEGARFPDECVRHKLLDAVGDMALCGSYLEGEVVSFRGGHSIHFSILKALRANRASWELLPAESLIAEATASRAQAFPADRRPI